MKLEDMVFRVVFHWTGEGEKELDELVKHFFEQRLIEAHNKFCKLGGPDFYAETNRYCEEQYGTASCDDKRVSEEHRKRMQKIVDDAFNNSILWNGLPLLDQGSVEYFIDPEDLTLGLRLKNLPGFKNTLNFGLSPVES